MLDGRGRRPVTGMAAKAAGVVDSLGARVRPFVREDGVAHRILRRARRHLPHVPPKAEEERAFDRVIREFGRMAPNATFVQIGSNDGVQLDPLREQILSRNWSGIMVEPVPYVFARLKHNYGGLQRVQLVNAAVSDHDGVQPFWYLPESDDPNLWEWYHALGSFREDIIRKHVNLIPDIDARIRCTDVRSLTFDSLCAEAGLSDIDLIQIDTEGYDWEIIKHIDFDRYHPLLVMFEHLHLSADEKAECYRYLRHSGYDVYVDGMDALCLRNQDQWVAPSARMRALWDEIGADRRVMAP